MRVTLYLQFYKIANISTFSFPILEKSNFLFIQKYRVWVWYGPRNSMAPGQPNVDKWDKLVQARHIVHINRLGIWSIWAT